MLIEDVLKLTRLDRPQGALLLFFPCAFTISLVSNKFDFLLLLKFLLASCCARACGCIINDILDRKIDAVVARTKDRPIASGRVQVLEAMFVLFVMLWPTVYFLLSLKFLSFFFCALSVPMIMAYPLMKRVTYFPQVFLGLTFNIGVFVACIESVGYISYSVILLYFACVFWTIGYDTIYGFMDIEDDIKNNNKSLSIFISTKNPKLWLYAFYSIFLALIFFAIATQDEGFSIIGFCLLLLPAVHLFNQIYSLDLSSSASCLEKFNSNLNTGIILCLALYLS
ncbi:MAG: UbiA family prenyltransferase [Rickettsiaceae bacterium]|nr:UbiA family prenyltransferase [Rickettsiaceae bacterium]